jgi:hypothetical protein
MPELTYLYIGNTRLAIPLLLIAICLGSCAADTGLKKISKLDDYPSASAIAYFDSHFYIMGDDSKHLLILDEDLNPTDSIALYAAAEKRIPKPVKADIEAITLTKDNKLLLLGSGSISPFRSGGWLIDPVTRRADSIRLDSFYRRLRDAGLEVLNIEGLCSIPGSMVMVNRGNKAWRRNDLIIVNGDFWLQQETSAFSIIRLGANTDSSFFNGISGLDYSSSVDQLLLTVSTENTYSNTGDGTIGKSYLWIVNDISKRKAAKVINPDMVIDLELIDKRFAGQKIESLCIIKETKGSYHLALTADNDDGSSTVFLIVIPRPRL